MTNRANWIWLCFIFCASIVVSVLFISSPLFSTSEFFKLSPEVHYSLISMSATVGGFVFTGVCILTTVLDKERISRLWRHHYLDNLYRSAGIAIVANIVTILVAIFIICAYGEHLDITIYSQTLVGVEVSAVVVGLVFFAWCFKHLIFVLTRLK